jgi:hypothetical protein
MKKYRCRVIRKQEWMFEIEAESGDEARNEADKLAEGEPPHNDWAYETTSHEMRP